MSNFVFSYDHSATMNQPEYQEDNNLFEHHRIVVDPKQSPIRIDRFLAARLPHVTRTKLQSGIQEGFVTVNNHVARASYKIRPHDTIVVSLPDPPHDKEIKPENIPLSVVYEDDFLMIINKPAGMVVHPAHQNRNGTLVNALVYHFQNLPHMLNNEGRPGLVHRIDKDTSGLLVVAKTEAALTGLAKQFFNHSIERKYWALVWGEPNPEMGTIRTNLGRSVKDRRITDVFSDESTGKRAVTHYKILKTLRYVSLVECQLETGRTHQIRAHMKHIGNTLFNDAMYGGNTILRGTPFSRYKQFVQNCFIMLPRQALHAKMLGFIHPITQEKMTFDSALPEDIKTVVAKWENYVKYN